MFNLICWLEKDPCLDTFASSLNQKQCLKYPPQTVSFCCKTGTSLISSWDDHAARQKETAAATCVLTWQDSTNLEGERQGVGAVGAISQLGELPREMSICKWWWCTYLIVYPYVYIYICIYNMLLVCTYYIDIQLNKLWAYRVIHMDIAMVIHIYIYTVYIYIRIYETWYATAGCLGGTQLNQLIPTPQLDSVTPVKPGSCSSNKTQKICPLTLLLTLGSCFFTVQVVILSLFGYPNNSSNH